MNKEDFEMRLCRLVKEVGRRAFHSRLDQDCFCKHGYVEDPRVHQEIIEFIEEAVEQAIRDYEAKNDF